MPNSSSKNNNANSLYKRLVEETESLKDHSKEIAEINFGYREEMSNRMLIMYDIEIKEYESYVRMRNNWSPRIFGLVVGVLIFQSLLTIAIAFDWYGSVEHLLNFKEFLLGVVGQNIAEIIGLGLIITKFLYPKPKKNKF
jgi:hypothetical protein